MSTIQSYLAQRFKRLRSGKIAGLFVKRGEDWENPAEDFRLYPVYYIGLFVGESQKDVTDQYLNHIRVNPGEEQPSKITGDGSPEALYWGRKVINELAYQKRDEVVIFVIEALDPRTHRVYAKLLPDFRQVDSVTLIKFT